MEINALTNGIVLDHIKAGKSMEIYNYLHLEELDCQVAMIQNATSKKMGKKDILKIASNIDLNLDILGFIDSGITVNIIRNNKKVEKFSLSLPKEVENVIQCKNPRCISSTEQGIVHKFKLTDEEKGTYRCIYCETEYGK